MEEVKRRLKEEKNAKDEDVLVSLQLVNEMLVRGYEFLPIELGKSRGSKYVVEDGKVRLPFSSLKGLGGAAADALEKVTIHGEEYISVEELQQASGVGSSILDRLRQVGALGDLPESSQVASSEDSESKSACTALAVQAFFALKKAPAAKIAGA